MSRTLRRGLVAALLSVVMIVSAGARPAQAVIPWATIGAIIDVATKAINLYKAISGGGGISDAALKEAVRQINAKIDEAKTEIIAHIDAIAAAEVRACVRHHVIEFVDIELFSPSLLQSWAQDATGCATLADSTLHAVTDKAAADELGLAVNVITPIAVAARARAGFSTFGIIDTLRTGNQAAMSKLAPSCITYYLPLSPIAPIAEGHYDCTAYNGDRASSNTWIVYGSTIIGPPPDFAAAERKATERTSREIAFGVLATL
jgi:hypothetical protein